LLEIRGRDTMKKIELKIAFHINSAKRSEKISLWSQTNEKNAISLQPLWQVQ